MYVSGVTTQKVAYKSLTADTTLTFGTNCTVAGGTVSIAVTFGASCDITAVRFAAAVTLGANCNMSGTAVAGALTAGASSTLSGCTLSSTVAPAASCSLSACIITGAVTVSGAGVTLAGCTLASFSSTSLNSHVIQGCTFTGAGSNVTLASSSSCVVKGNIACQVTESGTSDSNRYSDISTASTLTGASSIVTDQDKFAWTSPGALTTTDNALFGRYSPQISTRVRLLEVNVETAPTGATLTVDFRKGTKSTGALGAVIGTVTVAISAFNGTTTVSPAIVLASTEFIVAEITQVGSTIPGSNATMMARP